jgi:hypothetical protein
MGVVLIVALLGWSVNQRVVACTGLPTRAAVVAPAGSPPAPKPEPSPSRHNCCPLESKHSEKSKSAALPDCKMHASQDLSCCSIAKNPASRMPFQKVSRFELHPVAAVIAASHRQTALITSEDQLFSAIIPTQITGASATVLRL